MDKDEGAIGGLEHPPPVTPKLYYASMVMDIAGLLICCVAGLEHALVMSGYVAFSKAYSWHGIRLKKYAWLGWLMVAFFQGGYTYMLANMAATDNISSSWFTMPNMECMLIATLLIGAYYPLTQVYQHEEDSSRGDFTISYRLGVRGTFIFSALLFVAGAAITYHYFNAYYLLIQFYIFLGCLLPVVGYFVYWAYNSFKNTAYANYTGAMRMTFISSVCMIACFLTITAMNLSPG